MTIGAVASREYRRFVGFATGQSHPLGAMFVSGGVNFSIYSRYASGIELVLFDRKDEGHPTSVIRRDAVTNRKHADLHRFAQLLMARRLLRNVKHEQLLTSLNELLFDSTHTWRRWIDTALEPPHESSNGWRRRRSFISTYSAGPRSVVVLIAGLELQDPRATEFTKILVSKQSQET
jgi:pullulanase/glycogen debranching enzyme